MTQILITFIRLFLSFRKTITKFILSFWLFLPLHIIAVVYPVNQRSGASTPDKMLFEV